MDEIGEAQNLSPGKGLMILLYVVAAIGVYIGIARALGVQTLYGGFLFSLYFGAIKTLDPPEFLPSVLGSVGGVLVASLSHILPVQFGAAGYAVALVAIMIGVYASIMGWVPILINNAFLLFLTVATIPALQAEADFTGAAASVLIVAAMMGGLVLALRAVNRRNMGLPAE